MADLKYVGETITDGAKSFLFKEYTYLALWSAVFAIILGSTVDYLEMQNATAPISFPFTATSFLIGSLTSILAGYIGMRIAVYTNTRVTFQTASSTHNGFVAAFRGGQVLGFVLVGVALLNLSIIVLIFKFAWYDSYLSDIDKNNKIETLTPVTANATLNYYSRANFNKRMEAVSDLTRRLFELIAGYGLGGSSVALFGRVGGGIYTKAADVGADLVGKNLHDLREDDVNNPGTIADNVGDNVGDIAGMGSDLFGSLAESTCAALVVSATSVDLIGQPDALFFPLMITSSGVIASFVSVLLVHLTTVEIENVQSVLKF